MSPRRNGGGQTQGRWRCGAGRRDQPPLFAGRRTMFGLILGNLGNIALVGGAAGLMMELAC